MVGRGRFDSWSSRRVRLQLNGLSFDRSLTPSPSPRAPCRGAAVTFPAFGVVRRGRLLLVFAPLLGLRRRGVRCTGRAAEYRRTGVVCRTAFGVVHVRLVRRERVEVVSTAVGEEPGEECLPVEPFLAETPEAHRRRLVPDRRVAAIKTARAFVNALCASCLPSGCCCARERVSHWRGPGCRLGAAGAGCAGGRRRW